ncbi:ATPase, T2SS/T4P/T4SS family [Pyrobaculum neutrophilum]|uniref:Type II secretion system protein E n=1 Tax=Pyrobaculum neutrophilum (strain DSM 2338 / JCM 9278 / NBRC 100436 / V24Sta) TaxID=444157 RepID=B1Y926_PYRNV|nr:ATPase, T2SS/T4P/T4SS family [Pyrobaculum neutrophilum]ACB40255.1 type II secretion system protein E [Pyrobaculum neutrophilum V24Sta]
MYQLLTRILECAECRYSCREKGLCNFTEEEIEDVVKLASRIFKRDLDATLDFRYGLFKKIKGSAALRATLATVGLEELAPYLEQDDVEDLLLIPGRPIYITRRSGKEKGQEVATLRLVKNLMRLAYLKGVELTTATPSLRFGIRIGEVRMRISLDLPPVVPSPQAYVRIHRKKLRIGDLLKSGFLTLEQLQEIYRYVREGKHIVVTGPPGSGKTTLLVALDDIIPPNLQRVYIDEADEFEEDPDKNQIKIHNVNKMREVYASLNRNIDVIFVGELQYEDHFHAFRTATEMGIQTLATMHSTSVEGALRRLAKYVEVENTAIIQLSKTYGKRIERRVIDIYVK